jgi:hypothetical protein
MKIYYDKENHKDGKSSSLLFEIFADRLASLAIKKLETAKKRSYIEAFPISRQMLSLF